MPALKFSGDKDPRRAHVFTGDKPKSIAELKTLDRIPESTGQYSEIKFMVFSITVGDETKLFMRLGKPNQSHTPVALQTADECEFLGRPKYIEEGAMKVIGKTIILNTWYGKTDKTEMILRDTVCKTDGYELASEHWVSQD